MWHCSSGRGTSVLLWKPSQRHGATRPSRATPCRHLAVVTSGIEYKVGASFSRFRPCPPKSRTAPKSKRPAWDPREQLRNAATCPPSSSVLSVAAWSGSGSDHRTRRTQRRAQRNCRRSPRSRSWNKTQWRPRRGSLGPKRVSREPWGEPRHLTPAGGYGGRHSLVSCPGPVACHISRQVRWPLAGLRRRVLCGRTWFRRRVTCHGRSVRHW